THVWAQRPESVLGIIKSTAERGDAPDPDAELSAQEKRREEATVRVESRLSAWNRRRFRGLLRAAHEGISGRELAKSQWARSTHSIRLIVREAGRRLVERGLIDDVDDVFYMRLNELRAAIAGNPRPDLRRQVAFWKETKAICERVELPERFTGKPPARW